MAISSAPFVNSSPLNLSCGFGELHHSAGFGTQYITLTVLSPDIDESVFPRGIGLDREITLARLRMNSLLPWSKALVEVLPDSSVGGWYRIFAYHGESKSSAS
jgi:hypothetical protein